MYTDEMKHGSEGISYWTYGDTKKQPLLLIHGFTGSHDGFQYIVPLIEKDFFVIVPDLPGFGASEPAAKPWTVEHIAKRTNAFVNALGLKTKPHLISHSMGGLIGASMLAQNPELFDKKTIFISPVAARIGWLDTRKIGALAGRLQYSLGQRIAESKVISRIATLAIMTTKDRSLRKKIYRHHLDNLHYISSSNYYHDMHLDITNRGVIDFTEQLKSFSITIITGDKDNVTPLKGIASLASDIDAKLIIIPGVGHLAHYERPGEIAQAITDALL